MTNGGWVKLNDPKTGKTFYANHSTRQTQWDPPPGFVDPDLIKMNDFIAPPPDDSSLPPNWEAMHDEKSGKTFYVNHLTKKTTWDRPVSSNNANGNFSATTQKKGTATGFGFIPSSRTPSMHSHNTGNQDDVKSSGHNTVSWNGPSSSTNPATSLLSSYSPSVGAYDHGNMHSHSLSVNDDKSSKYYGGGSGGLPQVDFKSVVVADNLRLSCPSCGVVFSIPLKRRHHCRLCADVFCDTCSSHRVQLPLEGPQYEKPVRICNVCNADVERGNYFTYRRYLIPLQLYDPNANRPKDVQDSEWIGSDNVSGALTAMSQDFDSLLLDPTSFSDKMSIPADILVPAITRHIGNYDLSDRAIRTLSNLLALANVAGDNSFAIAFYNQSDATSVLEDMYNLLEQSGTSNKTLAVQEQAARALFYLTDANLIRELTELEADSDNQTVDACNVHRALRNMLDHTTSSASPSLQRWAAACIRNLLAEDYRRSSDAVTEAMSTGNIELRHESFITHLVSSGGIMILSSLMGSDDGDTRAHATAALSATILTARDMEIRLNVWKEAFGISTNNETSCTDAAIIEAIVSSGACGLSLAQLLLSADDAVAEMGCSFALSLVQPIITIPQGSELLCYHRLLSSGTGGMSKLDMNEDGLGPFRKAALDLATNEGIVPALIQLARPPSGGVGKKRPIELQKSAMEILAAITLTVAYWDCKLRSAGSLMEGDTEWEQLSTRLHTAQAELEEEQVAEAILAAYNSASVSSLNTSRDSLPSQLKEAASLIMGATAFFLPKVAALLSTNHAITGLITFASDEGMATESSLRGAWASRRLALLEATAVILVGGWKVIQKSAGNDPASKQKDKISPRMWGKSNMHGDDSSSTSSSLDLLLEALDGGIIPLVSYIIDSQIEYHEEEKACSNIRAKIACCHIIAAIFGICESDKTNIGFARLYGAIEVNASNWGYQNGGMRNSRSNGQNLISSTIFLLQSTSDEARQYTAHEQGSGSKLPLLKLVEANLLSLGSICGAPVCGFSSNDVVSDETENARLLTPQTKSHEYQSQVQMACMSVCDVITKNSFLSSALVGIFGEGSVLPVLRLVSAIAEMGPETVHADLAQTGFLVPITDMLRDAVVAGDYSVFTATNAVIRSCGPHITASAGESSNIKCLRDCIELLSNVLTIEESPSASNSGNSALGKLKRACIFTIEQLSSNSSLWTTIASNFVPRVSEYLFGYADAHTVLDNANICAALRAIQKVVSLPTNADYVAQTGIGAALTRLICIRYKYDEDDDYRAKTSEDKIPQIDCDVENLALQLLHLLAPYITAMCENGVKNAGLIHCGAVDAACCSLSTNRDIVDTKLGLELFSRILSEVTNIHESIREQHTSLFVKKIMEHKNFVRRLCATMLNSCERGKNPSDAECKPIIAPIYGSTLSLSEEPELLRTAISILFVIAANCSLTDSVVSASFWDLFFDKKNRSIKNSDQNQASIVAACAVFLNTLADEEKGICVPRDSSQLEYYQSVSLPCVRERLLYGLHTAFMEMNNVSGKNDQNVSTLQNLLFHFGIVQACLSMCTSSANIDSAFTVLQTLLHEYPDITLSAICSESHSLAAVYEMLSVGSENNNNFDTKPEFLRQFSALALSSAAGERGILGPATKKFGLRSIAIASLSAACLADELDTGECIEEDLAGSGLSIATMCMRSLVGVLSQENKEGGANLSKNKRIIVISPGEAKAISSSLGKKLSEIILARFMKHAEVQDLEDADSSDKDLLVTESPEVLLLCALASKKEALPDLCAHGGLDALSLVAAEGETAAILGLHEACKGDPSAIIDVEGHISIMQVIATAKSNSSKDVNLACLNLLVTLSSETKIGRDAVSSAELCDSCINFSSRLLCSSISNSNHSDNDTCEENQSEESDDKKTVKKINTPYISLEEEEVPITLSSLSFLTSLLCVPKCRERIFEDETLRECLNVLVLKSGSFVVQHAIIKFLSTAARYIKKDCNEESYSVEFMTTTFLSVIRSSQSVKNKPFLESNFSVSNNTTLSQCNQNLVHASTCSAIECVLCHMSSEKVSEIATNLQQLFINLIDYAASPGKKLERKMRNSGMLICGITSIFIRLLGSDEGNALLLNTELLSSFIKFVLVNPPKALPNDIVEGNKTYWDCALNQCLQCLAALTIERGVDINNSVSWKEVISAAESAMTQNKLTGRFQKLSMEMARKRPTTQVKFSSSLKSFSNDVTDPCRSVASRQILERLES